MVAALVGGEVTGYEDVEWGVSANHVHIRSVVGERGTVRGHGEGKGEDQDEVGSAVQLLVGCVCEAAGMMWRERGRGRVVGRSV